MTIAFVPTPNQTDTGSKGRTVDLLVMHTMEAPEKGTTAEAVAQFFAKPTTKASAHYNFDNNSIVQCVKEEDVAWAAPGANHDGIQFEHAGFARQSPAQWDDPFSRAMLELSIDMAAQVVKRHNIPVVFLRAPDLAAQRRGITTHAEVSKAFRLSDHTDPGVGFPMQDYLTAIRLRVPTVPKNQPVLKEAPPTLKRGDTGWRVKQAQRLLVAANQKLIPDGVFGFWTEAATKAFQKRASLRPDGVIGPMTWKALWQHYYLEKA